jgi:hypothetical protein
MWLEVILDNGISVPSVVIQSGVRMRNGSHERWVSVGVSNVQYLEHKHLRMPGIGELPLVDFHGSGQAAAKNVNRSTGGAPETPHRAQRLSPAIARHSISGGVLTARRAG